MRDANKYIMDVIADIQKQLSYHTGDPCISHYLKNYGFTKEDIKDIYNNLDEEDVHELIIHEDRIINILNYLKSIGILLGNGNDIDSK